LQSIAARDDDVFVGESGAIMSGARLLTSFIHEGNYWVASGQTEEGQVHGECQPEFARCNRPEDFFIDDQPLHHVSNLAEVGPGDYFFDYPADKIYFYDNPIGKKVEVTVTRSAIYGSAANVTVRNLIIEKYGNSAQTGALGDQHPGPGWIVESNEVRYNHGLGIRIGTGGKVIGNKVHHNGQMGIGGEGDSILVERNDISYNNNLGFDWGWSGGGTKFAHTTNLKVRCNYVHHNKGPGL